MYIESVKNENLLNQFPIIELRVRGNEAILDNFFSDIQDYFDLAHDDWDKSLSMLTMTFDYQPKIQTLTKIKRFTKDYIKNLIHN